MLKNNATNKIVMLVVILCFTFTPAAAYASAAVPPIHGNYVALGDSLAAGVTPDGDDYDFCSSYADFLSGKVSAEGTYDNFGVPGLMAVDLFCLLHGHPTDFAILHNHLMAQSEENLMMVIQELNGGVFNLDIYNALISNDPVIYSGALSLLRGIIISKLESAEVVTLDIGANDVFYALELEAQNPGSVMAALNNLPAVLQGILGCIDMNSTAKVYFMNYYNPYSSESDPRHVAFDSLNARIAEAIATYNAPDITDDVVPVLIDNSLDSAVNPEKYLAENQIHPTQSGYQLIAKEFWAVMKGK